MVGGTSQLPQMWVRTFFSFWISNQSKYEYDLVTLKGGSDHLFLRGKGSVLFDKSHAMPSSNERPRDSHCNRETTRKTRHTKSGLTLHSF